MSPTRWSQISEVLERALELPTQARPAFLAETCGEDENMRAEVESLLGAHQAAGESFLADDALVWQAAETLPSQPPDLSGQTIKQFVLLRRIGLGGMGEVYLANDTSLRRQVALKLLPAQTMLEDERLRRFAREARAASSLNHPNIMTVYEFGQEKGQHFIVTEYVEGQTLRAQLAQPPLSLDETLAIADQILAALSAAHAAGIIHRDIKPENLMLRSDGVVKVLDFGIAKLLPRAREAAGGPAAATRFLSTEQGLVLGTPGYMSPEQVRGLEVTTRSDLFSFGVVLYELLTGQLPFQGETNADFIAQVLTTEPRPLVQRQPDLPPAYDALLQRLLDKDPGRRMATAQEVRLALAQLPRELLSKSATQWEQLRRARRQLAWAVGLLLLCVAVGAGFWRWRKNIRENATLAVWSDFTQVQHTDIYTNKLGREISSPAFSPNGQLVAFGMSEDLTSHLYTLPRQGGVPHQLTFGSATDRMPIWSPDGQRLACISNRLGPSEWGIWVLPYTGGKPELLWKLPSQEVELLDWRTGEAEERIFFAHQQNLLAVSLRSRKQEQVTQLPLVTPARQSFSLSPEGTRLIYLETKDQKNQINLLDLRDGRAVTLLSGQDGLQSPHWFAGGKHIVFIGEVSGHLQPQLFSLAQHKAVPLNLGSDDYGDLAVAPDGRAVLGRAKNETANIYAIDRQGQETTYTTEKVAHLLPMPVPDGKRVMFQVSSGYLKSGGRLLEKMLGDAAEPRQWADAVMGAQWSPDGKRLAYIKHLANQRALFVQGRADQKGHQITEKLSSLWLQLLPYNLFSYDFTWTSDSQRLVYVSRAGTGTQLWQVEMNGLAARALLPPSSAGVHYLSPVCAPQSGRVAFISVAARNDAQTQVMRQVMVVENNQPLTLHETKSALQMVGWLRQDEELLVAEGREPGIGMLQDATLLKCLVSARRCQPITALRELYLPSLQLSHDQTTLAFVTQTQHGQNINLLNLNTGQVRPLTQNSDPGLFYSGVRWTYDDQRLFFSKQIAYEILTLMELR